MDTSAHESLSVLVHAALIRARFRRTELLDGIRCVHHTVVQRRRHRVHRRAPVAPLCRSVSTDAEASRTPTHPRGQAWQQLGRSALTVRVHQTTHQSESGPKNVLCSACSALSLSLSYTTSDTFTLDAPFETMIVLMLLSRVSSLVKHFTLRYCNVKIRQLLN